MERRKEQPLLPAKTERTENTERSPQQRAVRTITYVAMFTAVIAVCSQLAVHVGEIPYTLQTLAVCLTAGLLGLKKGTLAVATYIIMGVFGIPVFSGFKNFYALIGGASAGYVIGFIFTSAIVGFVSDRLKNNSEKGFNALYLLALALSMVIGVAVCYFFGTLWFMFVYKDSATTANLQIALAYCVYPYVVADLIKIVVATILTARLKKYVK